MSENRKIISSAGLVGSFTTLSRIFGLVRDMVIARFFGASMATDAFFVAFRIPNILRRLFAEGALTVSFIPVLKEAQVKEGHAEAKRISDIVFTFLTIILAFVVITGILLAPIIVKLIAPGFTSPDKYELTVYLTRIIFPYIFLICIVAFAMGVLNSVGRFAAPAAAPVLLNISIIFSAIALSPLFDQPVVALSVGVLAGGVLQVLLQIPSMKKEGYLPSISFDFKHPALKKLLLLMAPALFGIAVYQLNIFVSTIIASFLPEGSVSYLYYADRFFQLPLGIFVISLATAILPTMSDQVASNRLEDMRDSLAFSIKVIFFVTLPAAAGLYAVSIPVFSLFFQRGEFDYSTTVKTAQALQFYAVGLWAIGGVKIIVPAFYAMQDMKTPVKAAFFAFIANIVLSLLLMGPLQHGGLALATSLSSLLNFVLLLLIIRKRVGAIVDRSLVLSFMRSLIASVIVAVIAGFICSMGNWEVDGMTIDKVAVLSAAIGAGMLSYFLFSFLFRSEEMTYILNVIKTKVRGRLAKD
ncbi:MAG: murein biosynthesis integral membrane protein MurJ [Proteobacteria bacterium]|nr:murein biosynthesis integral membrane protein MurJ [Pseudomonadota bacterium]